VCDSHALLRRRELIARQFTTRLAPIAPAEGAQVERINIDRLYAVEARSSNGLRAPACPSEFAAELIRLSLKVERTMAYEAEISRKNPGCFLVLVDQSESMEDPFGGGEAGEGRPRSWRRYSTSSFTI